MAGQRLPLEVVQARGSKHLTKAEIQERQEREIKPVTDNIIAPDYLTKTQNINFHKLSQAFIKKFKIFSEKYRFHTTRFSLRFNLIASILNFELNHL